VSKSQSVKCQVSNKNTYEQNSALNNGMLNIALLQLKLVQNGRAGVEAVDIASDTSSFDRNLGLNFSNSGCSGLYPLLLVLLVA